MWKGFEWFRDAIDDRIGSLHNAQTLIRDLRLQLATLESCGRLFDSGSSFDLSQMNKPTVKIPVEVLFEGRLLKAGEKLARENVTVEEIYLSNLVDLGPVDSAANGISFQARLKLKLAEKNKEFVVGLVKFTVEGERKLCVGASSEEDVNKGTPCKADNSPDQMRPGGRANIVNAPDGTTAVSGKLGRPVFAFDGAVKWLPMPACGPVNYCQNGRWTTTAVIECKD